MKWICNKLLFFSITLPQVIIGLADKDFYKLYMSSKIIEGDLL